MYPLESNSAIIASILVALTTLFIVYFKYALSYWKRKGVPSIKSSIPFGSVGKMALRKAAIGEVVQDFYKDAKSKNLPHIGYYFFGRPIYVAVDPVIIKHILQTDFDVFTNRGFFHNEKDDPLSANLFTLGDAKWKTLRQNFTQTFTSGQLKRMFQTLVDTSVGLNDIMEEHSHGKVLNIRDVIARYTTDVIASCAFGIECNTLKEPDSDFRKYGRKVFETSLENLLKLLMLFMFPNSVLKLLRFKNNRRDVEKFFLGVINETAKYREANNVYRHDFMHLLLQLKNRGKLTNDGKVTGEKEGDVNLGLKDVAAQAFLFYTAGYETSSTASSFSLYELAINQKLQDEVRGEIREVLAKHDDKITYDAIMEMKLLQRVLDESLRKYPPVPVLDRECSRPYKIPGTDAVLEQGVHVHIPVYALHRDPEYYPNPEKFDPERFTEENKKARPQFTYLPFGDGPRICIGLRFGIIQSKVAMAIILKNHRVTLNPKTKIPLVMDASSFVLQPDTGIWIDVAKID